MAQVVQNQNQFAMTPMLGAVTMIPTPDVVSCRFNPASVVVLQAGSAVKLLDGTAAEILVEGCTGPTDGPVFGVVVYNQRKSLYAPGDVVEVACPGSIIILESSAAIVRGAKVTGTAATAGNDPTVATVTVVATQFVIGIALDKATATGQLIRVKVQPSLNLGV